MTARASVSADGLVVTPRRPTDTRTLSRWVAAVLMPIGPACIAWLRFVLPYDTDDDVATMLAKVAEHPGTQAFTLWLGLVATFTLIPGALAALRLVRPGSPRLAIAAAATLVPAYTALVALPGTDLDALAAARAGLDLGPVAELVTAAQALPHQVLLLFVFVLGHIVGTVLLGLAMWRSRVVAPAWGWVMALSQPVHLVSVIIGNRPLDLVAWGSTAVAMGAAAVAVVRLHDGDWDVPPRVVVRTPSARTSG